MIITAQLFFFEKEITELDSKLHFPFANVNFSQEFNEETRDYHAYTLDDNFVRLILKFKTKEINVFVYEKGKILIIKSDNVSYKEANILELDKEIKKIIDSVIAILLSSSIMKRLNVKDILTNYDYKIENIVATKKLSLLQNIDLNRLVFSIENAIYDPSLFPAVLIYFPNEFKDGHKPPVIQLFANGHMNCVGAQNVIDIKKYLRRIEKDIKEIFSETQTKEKKPHHPKEKMTMTDVIDELTSSLNLKKHKTEAYLEALIIQTK